MKIAITLRPSIVDLFATLDDTTGILTDEHPASSYGIPVLLIGGQLCGPAELAATGLEMFVHYTYQPDLLGLYESDEQIRARRNPSQIAAIAAAAAAGYLIANP